MILITGATGQVGSAAMNALVAADAKVRALVRRPFEFAAAEDVRVVQGSFDDDRSLARALEGVDVMLLAGRDSPDSVSVAGHAVAYEPVAPEDFEVRLLAAGIPGWRAFDLAHIASAYSAAENAVSPDLPMLLGRKPRSLSEFTEDHQNAFSS